MYRFKTSKYVYKTYALTNCPCHFICVGIKVKSFVFQHKLLYSKRNTPCFFRMLRSVDWSFHSRKETSFPPASSPSPSVLHDIRQSRFLLSAQTHCQKILLPLLSTIFVATNFADVVLQLINEIKCTLKCLFPHNTLN